MDKLKDFIGSGIKTTKKIRKSFIDTSHTEDISQIKLFGSRLKQSTQWAFHTLKAELSTTLAGSLSASPQSDKVVILISGYNLTGKTLKTLQKEIHAHDIHTVQLQTRFRDKADLRNIIQEIYTAIAQHPGKRIVLFGYSSWGLIAHNIWERLHIPSLSYGLSKDLNTTMVSTLLSLYSKQRHDTITIPPLGKNIIEGFSEMTPEVWLPERTERISGVHTHMSMHQKRVIEKLTSEIKKLLE